MELLKKIGEVEEQQQQTLYHLQQELQKSKTPFVIDCIIDSDDKVWPMVAPGKPINESFDEEDYNATQGGN